MGLSRRALGKVAQARGEFTEAEHRLGEALRTFQAIQSRFDVGRTHLALAELARAQGQPARVAEHLAEAALGPDW